MRRFLVSVPLLLAVACETTPPPASSYYQERIDPIVRTSCAQQTNGCHVDVDGNATGNLDLSSYDALMRREDVLSPYGPYPVGLLLLKGGNDVEISVETWDPDPTSGERVALIETDIRHSAGSTVDQGSRGYAELKRWIESGYARTGMPDESLSTNIGECVNGIGHVDGFDPAAAPIDGPSFDTFVRDVQPVLVESCAGSGCHGNRFADLFISCGDTDEERRWNYYAALSHVTTPVSTSGLLRRPLATFRGGTFHEGGNVLGSTDDEVYQTLLGWAEEIEGRAPAVLVDDDPDPGLRFFANRVQPVLVRKGCMFGNCHAPSMFHDLRLRGGDQGVFSRIATRRNYEMSRELLAIESPDPNASRLVGKNLFPPSGGGTGLVHRGGSLFEDFSGGGTINPATPDDCVGVDADGGDLNEIPAYCVLVRWHEIEREEAAARGEILPTDEVVRSLVWVSRPPGIGRIDEFDTFRGGADLLSAPLSIDASGAATLGASTSLASGCGIAAGADVRTPAVSWDGSRVAFAARASASEPLRIYWMNSDGTSCEQVPGLASAEREANGVLLHDFDPAFAPDGRLVFASTRGNIAGDSAVRGPTRTPAAMQPNSNLYVFEDGSVRQLTFLLNQELAPNFMRDGRIIMSAQKREPGFAQMALRRQNLDGGDYHPLFAQRESLGFDSATEVVELPAGNELVFIAGPLDATDGAGAIALANRSIGPDQEGRDPAERQYLHSLSLPAAGAFGAIPGVASANVGSGVFRSPAPLPNGHVIASCDLAASDLRGGPFAFQLCEIDVHQRTVRNLGGVAGMANVEAVAVYGRGRHPIFQSRQDEANGASEIGGRDGAELHILDWPLLETLLFSNVRGPRPIDPAVGGVRIFAAQPPPQGTTSFAEVMGNVQSDEFGQVFVDYQEVGFVPVEADGSARILLPGGVPVLLQATDGDGTPLTFGPEGPFTGERIQREQIQLYPGERLNQSFPRRFFNGLCGTCHGSITGRELDAAVLPDILSHASRTIAADTIPVDLR